MLLGIAAGCIILGIIMIWGSKGIDRLPLLAAVVFWVGAIVLVVGLVFLVSPGILWLNGQLKQMLGA